MSELGKLDVAKRLAKTVLHFQDAYLSMDVSPSGLLCQVWLPEEINNGRTSLKTKGLPFCVAGMGDLLALFRCISCRFSFPLDDPAHFGAPGRVYNSGEPELACNVQHYPRGAYLRQAEAEQCHVQSSMLLPVFTQPPSQTTNSNRAVAILEVVQTSDDMQFMIMADLISQVLKMSELYTCSIDTVMKCLPKQQSHMVLPNQTGLLGNPLKDSSGGSGTVDATAESPSAAHGNAAKQQQKQNLNTVKEDDEGPSDSDFGSEDINMSDDEDYTEKPKPASNKKSGSPDTSGGRAGNKRRPGNKGKPGTKLQLKDLQSQFGVGLKEAAARLGICPTTLKRACRRHGIQRWPRRALQKVNQALDEMEKRQKETGAVAPVVGGLPPVVPDMNADTRWTTLASFIPAFQGDTGVQPAIANTWLTPQQQLQQLQYQQPVAAQPTVSDTSLPSGMVAITRPANKTQPTQQQQQQMAYMQQMQQQQRANLVPFFLQPDGQQQPQQPQQQQQRAPGTSLFSYDSKPGDPVLRLPELPGVSDFQGLSTLSIPSLGMDLSYQGAGGSLVTSGPIPGLDLKSDDVGLLDTSILELLLSEDHQKKA